MIPKPATLMLLALALLIGTAAGEAADDVVYVTDELRLGLFDGEGTTGRPARMLTSGNKLQILERALRSIRVRTEDGDEGWVKAGYVVATTPARHRVAPLEARNEQLTETLAAVNASNEALQQERQELAEELAQARQSITQLPDLEREIASLRQTLSSQGSQVHLNWLIAAATLAFVTGCLAGYYWLDRRVRKRFGGLRVY